MLIERSIFAPRIYHSIAIFLYYLLELMLQKATLLQMLFYGNTFTKPHRHTIEHAKASIVVYIHGNICGGS